MSQPFLAPATLGTTLHHQGGFSLIEVLVAVIILSIGVFGAVGMQVTSLQASKDVRYQAIAGSMARELAEKMRGNHAVAITTTVVANPYLLDTTLAAASTVAVPALNCYTTSCPTGVDIARWDIYDWQLRLKDALPSPRVAICMDKTPFAGGMPQWGCSNTGDVAVLKLAWNRVNTKGELEFTTVAGGTPTIPLLVLPLTAGSSQ